MISTDCKNFGWKTMLCNLKYMKFKDSIYAKNRLDKKWEQ